MFVGITRFSLLTPNSNAWYLSKDISDIEDYRKKLFSKTRLDERMNIFFNISLPALKIMKDKYEYIHILQISDQLPVSYKKIIEEYTQKFNFLKIQEVDINGNSNLSISDIIIRNIKKNSPETIIGVFNLDDDDILSVDYLKNSEKYINRLFKGHIISYGTGLTGLLDKNQVIDFKECYQPKINIGLMRVGSVLGKKIQLPNMSNHKFCDKYSPTIINSKEVMYFWGRHFNQDSSKCFDDKNKQINIILNDLSQFDDIDMNDIILKKFPSLNFLPSKGINKEILFNDNVEKEGNIINYHSNSNEVLFKIEFEVADLDKVLDKSRAVLLSFIFDKQVETVNGLVKSSDVEIGFFKYLSVKNIKNTSTVSLVLPEGINLTQLKIKKWKCTSDILIKKVTFY